MDCLHQQADSSVYKNSRHLRQ